MTVEQKSKFRSLRAHGQNIGTAARRAGLTVDQAHRLEWRRYCPTCYDYVTDEQCAHWDMEGNIG